MPYKYTSDQSYKHARKLAENLDLRIIEIPINRVYEAYLTALSAEFKGKTVTWHEPCHLGRYLGVKEQPRQILKSLSDVGYVEMSHADSCCGMAGTFSVYFYKLSQKIAAQKVDDIQSTNADIVVTDCPGCQIHLIDSLRRHGLNTQVRHIMELFE